MDPNISELLNNPEELRALLKHTDIKKIISELDREERGEKKRVKTAVTVKDRFDRYEQFAGVVITVTHDRIPNGKMTQSIKANGRSPRETHAAAEVEVQRLKKRYRIA